MAFDQDMAEQMRDDLMAGLAPGQQATVQANKMCGGCVSFVLPWDTALSCVPVPYLFTWPGVSSVRSFFVQIQLVKERSSC